MPRSLLPELASVVLVLSAVGCVPNTPNRGSSDSGPAASDSGCVECVTADAGPVDAGHDAGGPTCAQLPALIDAVLADHAACSSDDDCVVGGVDDPCNCPPEVVHSPALHKDGEDELSALIEQLMSGACDDVRSGMGGICDAPGPLGARCGDDGTCVAIPNDDWTSCWPGGFDGG